MRPIIFLLIFLFLVSCKKSTDPEQNVEARELFAKSVALLQDFNTMIKNAQDSTAIDSLLDLFDKRITEINFNYPPLTDLKLSEQENDSLQTLILALKTAKEDKLKEFASIPLMTQDSLLMQDSVK